MPAAFVNSLLGSSYVGYAWKWDASEPHNAMIDHFDLNGGFSARTRNYMISGGGEFNNVATWLTWDYYKYDAGSWVPAGVSGWLSLWPGALIVVTGSATYPQPFNSKNDVDYAWAAMPGCWESDELGRPFRLEDLIAD